MDINILAIESSCDETSASVIKNGVVANNIIATQSIHAKYGGVVPELASRAHQQNIVPVVKEALAQGDIALKDLNAVAFTRGPGLLGALLVGSSFAKSMAMALDIPVIGVNHMKAHILAHFIEEPRPKFPFLCLTVSGGHTQIVKVSDFLTMEVLGQTIDDAVGEAFDKCAKIIGLEYPGGPLIDKYAKNGDTKKFKFPQTAVNGLNYSFSGIKTAFLYFIRKAVQEDSDFIEKNRDDICASIQAHLIDMLMKPFIKAAKQERISELAIAGGVSANSCLRATLNEHGAQNNCNVYIPKFEYCTDNAAMIAMTAHYQYLNKEFDSLDVAPMPRMPVV